MIVVDPAHHNRLKQLHAKGLPDREIANATGWTINQVCGRRRRLGLKSNSLGEFKGPYRLANGHTITLGTLKKLHGQGKTDREIAKSFKCSRSAVLGWRRRLGLPPVDQKAYRRRRFRARKRLDCNGCFGLSDYLSLKHRLTAAKLGWLDRTPTESFILNALVDGPLAAFELVEAVAEKRSQFGYSEPTTLRTINAAKRSLLKVGLVILSNKDGSSTRMGNAWVVWSLSPKAISQLRERAESDLLTRMVG